jgi:hypothetical protein
VGPGRRCSSRDRTLRPVTLALNSYYVSKVLKLRYLAATRASVDDKLARYLLNTEHPIGKEKARWFKGALGFTKTNADDLAKQIVLNEKMAKVTAVTEHGTKFNQIISVTGANGKVINVQTAWIRNKDGVVRLVTATPTKVK